MMRQALGATAGGGALVAALATGWVGIALIIAVISVPTLAVCWIVADADRPQRLALLLAAWRHDVPALRPGRSRINNQL